MIELSAALVLVAALAAFVSLRYFAMKLQLAKPDAEHVSLLVRMEDRLHALEGAADRLTELEFAVDLYKQNASAHNAALAEQTATLGTALDERIAKAEQKYDAVLKRGINEMREIVLPIDTHYKRMVNGRASAAVPTKGTTHG